MKDTRSKRSARWSELPAEVRVEVDRWVNVLASYRDDDAKTLRVLRAAREALPDAITKEASWWRRMLLKAAERSQ